MLVSGHVSSTPGLTEAPRRELTARQAAVVEKLTNAAVHEIRAKGYEGLTVRNVAARARVAPATAYTYFASKDHVITEVFWRRLRALPDPTFDRRRGAAGRVVEALRDVVLLVSNEPELAAACTTAMLASDPDVKRLRDRIGAQIRHRIRSALGDHADPSVLRALELAVSGALLQAGMGHLRYADLPRLLEEFTALLVKNGR
jgi:AcrR family transcriptional regulator